MNRLRKKISIIMAGMLCVTMLAACGDDSKGAKSAFHTGMDKNAVFQIGDELCTKEELMVYLVNTQNQYEEVYGTEIWKTAHNGVTLEENVKETVLAKIAQIKTMYLMAKERQIELTEQEAAQVEAAANAYFQSLNAKETEVLGVTLDAIQKLYREYALAEKIYQQIIQDINPEISDDEARIITVQHIMVKTCSINSDGSTVPYATGDKIAAYNKAVEIWQKAIEGKNDFEELAAQYSEDDTITYSFGKGEMDQAFEEAAFGLETDAVSEVVESQTGYHIIKCINTFDREETDANKIKIVEQRRNMAFGQEYDAFVDTLVKQLNEELWSKISLVYDEQVSTSDFFDVYYQVFSEDQEG